MAVLDDGTLYEQNVQNKNLMYIEILLKQYGKRLTLLFRLHDLDLSLRHVP